MSYLAQSELARDPDFYQRSTAAAAVELDDRTVSPPTWTDDNIWWLSAAPGFADAYASALASGVERPGADQAVISDAQLLAAVQAVMGAP